MHTPRLFLLWVSFGLAYLVTIPRQPQQVQTSRHLELRLEADQVGEQDIPETMVITLVNSSDHEVRLPKPTVSCGDSYFGEVRLRLKFTPLKEGEKRTGHACFLDHVAEPDIAVRAKNWEILKPGDTLVFRVRVGTDFNRSLPGRYEFYADYQPPGLKPDDQSALRAVGIDFPHEALKSPRLIFAKQANAIRGTVRTVDGKPIVGAKVSGSIWKTCCPYQRDTDKTNDEGEFSLEHPGSVIHVYSGKYEPQTVIVQRQTSTLEITLKESKDNLPLAFCAKPRKGFMRLGWSKYGLQFDVPRQNANVLLGKVDVDYIVHTIKAKEGDGRLELWFGPYAMDSTPEDEQFIESVFFEQRDVIAAQGVVGSGMSGVFGLDSRGRKPNGKMWRRVYVPQEGAMYNDVQPQVAKLFDSIIDSLCWVPYPPTK